MGEQLKAIMTVAGTLLLMVLVFVGAYYASRMVGGNMNRSRGSSKGRIEILDRTIMGKDQSLLIVRVAGKVLLLSVTSQQIQKVDELDPNLFSEEHEVPPTMDFKTVLKDAWKQRTGKQGKGDDMHR